MAYPTAEYSIAPPPPTRVPGKPPAAHELDYEKLLQSDPVLQAAVTRYNPTYGTDTTAAQSALSTSRQQALIGYGDIPTNLPASMVGNIAPDITDTTRGLAEQNTQAGISTTAQLAEAYKRRQGGDIASLGGRGALRSGAYAQHSRENLQDYQVAQAKAATDVLGSLAGLWQGYTQGVTDRAGAIGTATSDALTRAIAGINAGDYGAPTAATPTTTTRTASTATAPPPAAPPPPGAIRAALRAGKRQRRFY